VADRHRAAPTSTSQIGFLRLRMSGAVALMARRLIGFHVLVGDRLLDDAFRLALDAAAIDGDLGPTRR